MAQEHFEKNTVSTSKFYMLRCLVAMAHADGVVHEDERDYIHELMDSIPLNDEQKSMLEADLKTAQKIEDLLPFINDPVYRGQLPYFARLMAFKDGELHPDEEVLLNKMHAYAVDGLDLPALRAEAKRAADYEMAEFELSMEELRHKGGYFRLLDRILRSMGIDLMRI